MITKGTKIIVIRFAFDTVSTVIFLTVEISQFALFERIEEINALTILTMSFFTEGFTMTVFILTDVIDDVIALFAFQTFSSFKIILNAFLISSGT